MSNWTDDHAGRITIQNSTLKRHSEVAGKTNNLGQQLAAHFGAETQIINITTYRGTNFNEHVHGTDNANIIFGYKEINSHTNCNSM